jgi:hypothetical protein
MSTLAKSTTGFRQATQDDLEQVVQSIYDLRSKHPEAYGIDFDEESVVATALHAIRHGVCLIGHGAVAGANFVPFIWNRRVMTANVVFWNFKQSCPRGIHIFQALLYELEKRGATHISCTSHYPSNRIGEFYAKMGMNPAEQNFIGEIRIMKSSCTIPAT